MTEMLEKSVPLVLVSITVILIVATWKWIWKWIKKLPARFKKRWRVKTGAYDSMMMTFDGEFLSRPRRPKNWWCALLLFLGKKSLLYSSRLSLLPLANIVYNSQIKGITSTFATHVLKLLR